MKKVYIAKKEEVKVKLTDIGENQPVFCKKNGILRGMIVEDSEGFIVTMGGRQGLSGYHKTLQECIEAGEKLGFDFYVN